MRAESFSDGTATLSGGQLQGLKAMRAESFSTATLAGGELQGLKAMRAESFSDGTATLAGGQLQGLQALRVAGDVAASELYVGGRDVPGSWRFVTSDGALVFEAYDAAIGAYKRVFYTLSA